ncbi:PREDICTED: TNF receptor-associated factor 4-like [Amphimedon queenslandica]|uniref:MATH domain-containing protein n=1 Tax=Amphimedon queenslandica TaxID=400682 RepID=A0A1X7T270_AMPQE|nr:PREDICTED: TNF receptor-associated factor 4-like [Amphimedon queenslandica]|eukprot:XP_011408385.1 PREDICTED: TNF receptor-associated factor 4-like [Amphimedon queenslandica]
MFCLKKGPYQIITSSSHLDECPDLPVLCGCNEKIPQCSLVSHNETCPKAIIPCEYNTVGCEKRMKREEQEKHNEEAIKKHLEVAVKRINNLQLNLDVAMKEIDALQLLLPTNQVIMLNKYTKKKEQDDNWHSPGFYTSRGGYKMSLHVYPNGNGIGKGTHISCYIRLMAGEYDDTLEWPFQGEVTIVLLNQLEDKNHKKYTTSFDSTYKSSQRVREGRSTSGFGRIKFISHEELEYNPVTNCQYLKDDSLYFRVSGKATSKTKPWLVGASGVIQSKC